MSFTPASLLRRYEISIGLRYTRAKRRNSFISFISFASMAGITVGVMVLITVLSVMNGFGGQLRDRILGVVSHVTISGANGRLAHWPELAANLTGLPEVIGRAPYIMGQGMLTAGHGAAGVIVRGISPRDEPQVSDLDTKMMAGRLDDLHAGAYNIILGRELAWKLGVDVGSMVSLVIPQGQVTPAGLLPRLKRFKVTGLFEVGMYEYDSGLALMHIDDAATLYQLGDHVSGLRLKLRDVDAAPELSWQLYTQLGPDYRVRDWTQEHSNFFRALKIEKTVMFVILFLVVAVAAFNLVSTLVMVVTDKQAEIAILRTLGASPSSIMGVFMVQGSVIGVVGTGVGVILGVLLALNVGSIVEFLEHLFNTTFMPKDVYVISGFPSDLRWSDVGSIAIVSLLMSLVATVYPAWRAARLQPAEALRYE